MKQNSWITIKIYNILGQEVKGLIDKYEYAGISSVIWDGTNNYGSAVSSGVYFYKLIAHLSGSSSGEFIDEKKMVVIR